MKKVSAYVGDCLPDDIGIIVDDYPNEDGNSELAVNLDLGDSLLNLYREIKKDGSIQYVVISIDKNSKVISRYEAEETKKVNGSDGIIVCLAKLFNSVHESVN